MWPWYPQSSSSITSLALARSCCSDRLRLLAGTHGSPDLTCFFSHPATLHLDQFSVVLWDSALGSGPPPSNTFPLSPPVHTTITAHLVLHCNHLCLPRHGQSDLGDFSTRFSKSREIQSTLRDRVWGLKQTNPSITFFSSSKFHVISLWGKNETRVDFVFYSLIYDYVIFQYKKIMSCPNDH